MADKLVVLTILLLFVSFRPIFCDGETSLEVSGDVKEGENLSPAFEPGTYLPNVVENSVPSKEKSVHSEGTQSSQHVDEEHTADSESEENLEDTAAPADTAESKGSPGFFSQVLSELAAPLYEDDEQDFLSEDSDSEPPSMEDATAGEEVEDALHETNKDNKNSIEDSDETAETSKEHEQTEFDKKDLKPTEDRTTMLSDEDLEHLRVKSKSAKEEDMADKPEEEELNLNKKEEEELSLNKKEEEKQQDNKEKTDNEAKDLKIGEEAKEPMFEEENKVEIEKELTADKGKGKEEGKDREKDEIGDGEMGDGETGEDGERAGEEKETREEEMEKKEERTKQEKKEVEGETERVEKEEDKEREEEEESEEDINEEVEDETRTEMLEKEEKAAEEKKRAMEEQASKLALEKERRAAEEKERDKEEEARRLALEKENRAEEEREKEREEQEQYLALQKERKVEEEKREREKQEQDLALENEKMEREKQVQELAWENERREREKQESDLVLQKEKRASEERKRAIEEQARKLKMEKEKRAAEAEKQRKEEEAKRLRLESLQKQLKDVEESERREKERLHMEKIRKERNNVNGNKKVVKNPIEVPLHNDKSTGDEQLAKKKDRIIQKQEKASEDNDEEEHMKLKGAFDRKMAAEEAALKRKLEKLNEERQNFEKMAAEYRLSKQARQQKQQKGKEATKQRTGGETRNLGASTVSRSSVQKDTSQHQAKATTRTTANAKGSFSASKAGNTGGSTTRIVPGKQNTAANEKLAAKDSTAEEKPRPDESSQTTPTSVKEPVGGHTKEKAQATATVTASTTTKVEGEGLSSADVKSNHVRNGGKKTDPLSEKKETHTDNAQCAEGFCRVKPDVISLASRFQKVESSLSSKVVLGETQFANQENDSSQVNDTLSGYAAFMRAFRNFHDKTVQFVFSYWPAAKNTTRDVLAYVGLDGVFIQLCNDLAEVHPAILFITLVFGSLGFLYFFWSITFGRLRHGAQGPSPRDVLRSYEARARILEEEVKSLEEEKLKSEMDRNNYFKEKKISEEQLQDTNDKLEKLMKSLEKHKKDKHDVEALLKGMKDKYQKLINESKEKSAGIAECENTIADLKLTIETKEREIEKLNDNYEKQQMEKEKSEKHIEGLDEIIEQSGEEKEELEQQLTESKEKIQSLQADFDDQLLRLTELQEQYQFRCNEVEVLKDCLKQIKQTDGEEEPDEDEMAGRLKNLLDVAEFKSVSKTLEEKNAALETETEELRKIKKMLENDNLEKTERMEQAESKASQALLTQREKEIELEALQKYFKSTEVELHRKINAEESSRISIENQLQSEQAKASTAVVDADKYRQLYLDIKKQIEEIDESKKEQLSNMEKKAHQNWLDYRAAARENDGLKDENEILRRKLYDLEVRGSRPSSSASSQLNHVDGRDSPSRRSPMTGLPGHGSPVPFGAPPMMGPPPPPPPSSMFPGQRRPHPAEMLGMTPPRPPFPPPGPVSRGHATPPPPTNAVTPQSSKSDDRADSFAQDNKDGASQAPAPPMPGYGLPPPPHPAMMRMPMFPPNRPPMMPPPPPPSGQLPPMFMPRPGGQMPPFPPQGPRPQASSTPNRS